MVAQSGRSRLAAPRLPPPFLSSEGNRHLRARRGGENTDTPGRPHPIAERPRRPTGLPEQAGRGGGNREAAGGRGGRDRASGQGTAHRGGARPRASCEETRPGRGGKTGEEGCDPHRRGPGRAEPRSSPPQGRRSPGRRRLLHRDPAGRAVLASGSPPRRLRPRSVIGRWGKEPASVKRNPDSLGTNWSTGLPSQSRQLHLLPYGDSLNAGQ